MRPVSSAHLCVLASAWGMAKIAPASNATRRRYLCMLARREALAELGLWHNLQVAVYRSQVVSQLLEFGIGVLLGHAGHDGVAAADLGVVFGFVGLERHKQIVGMLSTQ